MYDGELDCCEENWMEREGDALSDTTMSRFGISDGDEPYEYSEFDGWDKFHWGYGKDGWRVLVGKNDGIRIRACIVDPDFTVCSGWFPVDGEEDVWGRIEEAEGLMTEARY